MIKFKTKIAILVIFALLIFSNGMIYVTKSANESYLNVALYEENQKNKELEVEIEQLAKSNDSLKKENKTQNDEIAKLKAQNKKDDKKNSSKKGKVQQSSTNNGSLNIPTGHNSFKSYTYYNCLNKNSSQWEMQSKAYTDNNGLRRIENDYLVAMGSYYSHTLGDRFKITLSNGNTFTVRICDFKSDAHTDSKHQYTVANDCMIEFYVSKNLNSKAKNMGNISAINYFNGNIVKIVKI